MGFSVHFISDIEMQCLRNQSQIKACLTCTIWKPVRVSGIFASVDVSSLRCQLHDLRERTFTHLTGGSYFYKVDISWLQLLQQGHRMTPYK